MHPIYCDECGRANGQAARTCLWCGASMASEGLTGELHTTRVHMEYLDGIARIEDAGPVRLSVNAHGLEVAELIPGSRSIKIPASSLLEASVVDASRMAEDPPLRLGWWQALSAAAGLPISRRKTHRTKEHNYLLTVRYESEGEIKSALFQRNDAEGLIVVHWLARMLSKMAKREKGRRGDAVTR